MVNGLILASKSQARKSMLQNAGFDFATEPANISENEIISSLERENKNPQEIAFFLAKEKAFFIAEKNANNFVIGSDQILIFEDKILSKVTSKSEAENRLKTFSGKTHSLISSVCVIHFVMHHNLLNHIFYYAFLVKNV